MNAQPEARRALNPYVALPSGRNVPLSWREEREDDFQRILRESYLLQKPCYCLCRPQREEERRLAIRQLGGTDTHWYLLARYPHSGYEHDPRCEWYEPPESATGRTHYETGVIKQREDGTLGIRLAESLETSRRPNGSTAHHHNGTSVTQAQMSLRGLLDLSWEQAGLDTWRPQFTGKRSWYTVNSIVTRTAEQIAIGGKRMADRMAIIVPRANEGMQNTVHAAWDAALAENRGLLLLGQLSELKEAELAKPTAPVIVHAAWGAYRISLRAESALIQQMRSRWARDLAALATPEAGARVIALLHVRPRQTERDRFGFVVAGALMRTSEAFIPCASSYEARVAQMLVDQGRMFRKPLRYDGDGVFPDFELLDTPRIVPMEVFGRSDPAYTTRRDEKIAFYRTLYGSDWWSWDATRLSDPPPFPPLAGQRKTIVPSVRI